MFKSKLRAFLEPGQLLTFPDRRCQEHLVRVRRYSDPAERYHLPISSPHSLCLTKLCVSFEFTFVAITENCYLGVQRGDLGGMAAHRICADCKQRSTESRHFSKWWLRGDFSNYHNTGGGEGNVGFNHSKLPKCFQRMHHPFVPSAYLKYQGRSLSICNIP